MKRFDEWVRYADEETLNDLADAVNSYFFEDEAWRWLEWWEIQYDRDEVRAWALSYGDDDDDEEA